jgi:transposase, IS5 family
VPDHSTIWRFRQEPAAHGLAEALFEEINRQLDARGLIVQGRPPAKSVASPRE